MTLLFFAFVTLSFSNYALGDDFGYDGKHGPQHWGDNFKTCLGKYQSPIDIEEKDVRTATFPPLQFSNVQDPHPAYMVNNGHTVMIRSTDPDPVNVPLAHGGPLNDTYVFQQLHFHWGESDDEGSEDLINNHSFSMELHAVFWKKSYESSSEALKHPDGLAVLAFLYQATDEPNPNFVAIVSQVPEIATVDSNVTINDVNILNKLIAPNGVASQDYYTYRGSLTTPPCLEVVQWIDFIEPQIISHEQVYKQLAVFRSIKSNDGSNLTHNYRPVQPLDDRTIYRNINNNSTEATKPAVTSLPTEATSPATTKQTTPVPTTQSTVKPTSPSTPKSTSPPAPKPTTASKTTVGKPTTVAPQEGLSTNSSGTMKSDKEEDSQHSGQGRIWSTSTLMLVFGISFLLPWQCHDVLGVSSQ